MNVLSTFNDGIEAAARQLEGAAADYDQMAIRATRDVRRDDIAGAARIKQAREWTMTSGLLRKQAELIRALCV